MRRCNTNKNIIIYDCNKCCNESFAKRKEKQDLLSILANDYNSQKLRENKNYYQDVCKYYYNTRTNSFTRENGLIHKVFNNKKIQEIYNNRFNKNIYSDTRKQNYYNKIYATVYNSMIRGLPDIPQKHYIANRKTIQWLKRYANSQGTTNDGWPAVAINGTS